ncbi:hypothetical protein [Streptomyces sp. BE133]|uniref:hypothetical protein n=1 Tax=Streptomyces sp. BE133 TaxID=3002523 RepID=UPI002E7814A5|nr:hypothetical protein [Streptomyces sp. BE133]MEE1813336.1 hypothetical protein [Streptomyces sp. BE133]
MMVTDAYPANSIAWWFGARERGCHIPTLTYGMLGGIVAVVEVKKNLHSAELRDACGQLNSVSEIEHAYYQGDDEVSDDPDRNMAPSVRTFAEMTGKLAWDGKGAVALSYEEDALLQTLLMEQISAVRVILGMHGFKSERAFRLSMANYLERNIGNHGFGPANFPQLIVSGKYSLVKANGRPFMTPLIDEWWPFYFSTPENPLSCCWSSFGRGWMRCTDLGERFGGRILKLRSPGLY